MAEEKESKTSKKDSDLTKKLRENPWIIATIALGVVCLILIGVAFRQNPGGAISEKDIGDKAVYFINTQLLQGQATVTLNSVAKKAGYIYEVTVNFQNKTIPTYFTIDGNYFLDGQFSLISTSENLADSQNQEPPAEIPKSDKPTAELYIFSYCPAGTAALDAFAKAASVLKSVTDLKVKFFSNMHGEHEKQQNMIQECIQQVAKEKYWDYASQYVIKIYNVCGAKGDIGCDKNESIKLMISAGINSDSVMACVVQKGETLYAQDQSDAGALQLQYSPSVVVNGVYIGDADRTPNGLKNLICEGFNTAPSVCGQQLGTTAATSSGNC